MYRYYPEITIFSLILPVHIPGHEVEDEPVGEGQAVQNVPKTDPTVRNTKK